MVALIVTRQQMITYIRNACRKAKDTCPHQKLEKDFNLVSAECMNAQCKHTYHSRTCEDCRTIINLYPWTVTIGHILQTLQKISIMPDDFCVLSTGRIIADGRKKSAKWNLQNDSLDDQDDACITTLYLWLKNI